MREPCSHPPTLAPRLGNASMWAAIVMLALFVAACLWSAMHWHGEKPRGATWATLACYWMGYALAALGLALLVPRSIRSPARWQTVAVVVLAVALLSRVALALAPGPQLSDDLYRYIHDGATLAHGANPYAKSPADVPPADRLVPRVDARVNHPTLVTIYQPAAQYVFAGISELYDLAPRWWKRFDPLRLRTFRLAFALLDVTIVAMLLWELVEAGRSAWWAAFYAWHPLAISEIAWSGHEDVIGIAAMVAGLLFAQRARGRIGMAVAAGVALAIAIAVKPIILPLLLAVAWYVRKHRPSLIAGALATVAALAAMYLPFALMPGGLSPMFATVHRFVSAWSFNQGLYGLVASLLASPAAARWSAVVLSVLAMGWVIVRSEALWRAALAYLLTALLLTSTAYPWYLLWCLALWPLALGDRDQTARLDRALVAGALVFSFTVVASYVCLVNAQGFAVPVTWRWGEYVPVFVVMLAAAVWQSSGAASLGASSAGRLHET